ncbi:hypothetical protein, partial [Zoogloea ramigera]|uniref:hypothetical protein n=1 Tax=Zoogloea ramigera TaxID=350 RepID=UPI001C3FAE70
ASARPSIQAWKRALRERLAALRLCIHEESAQVMPTSVGSPWLGFVIDREQAVEGPQGTICHPASGGEL